MSTSRNKKLHSLPSEKSTESVKTIKKPSRGLKAALIGLLLICVGITSGCGSTSRPLPEPKAVTVDASLMVKPNLTKQLLDVLSE